MSILSALKQQHSSIDDLAKLPQTMIMQMAQKKQIEQDMVAPILARKAELMDAAARSKTLQQAEQTPPTVLEQLIARNAGTDNALMMPRTPAEIGVAQLPVPERQYAGGGIVAFGSGGDVEEEEDLATELARDEAEMNLGSSIQDIYNMAKQGIGRLKSYIPESYESAKAKVSSMAMPETKRGSHPLEEKAVAMANKVGLDPRLMLHALYKETGGLKNPETAMSKAGAYGPMQLMASTAKDLGVDRKNVDENLYGGALYLKQMLDKYKDPQLALAAYNAGPGRVDKALRSAIGLSALPRETQGYMKYAEGGDVRHYYEGDYVDPMLGTPLVSDPGIGSFKGMILGSPENLLESGKITQKEYDRMKDKQAETKSKVAAAKNPPKEDNKQAPVAIDYDAADAAIKRENQSKAENDIFRQILAQNEKQREDIRASAKEDRNLALLAAGLGIAGGSSPYFLQNIGTGGIKGIESLAASKARRASEMNALSASDLKALYYGEENKRKNQALMTGMAERAIDNLSAYDAKLRKNFFMEGIAPTQKQIDAYEAAKRNDALYQRLARDANLIVSTPTTPVLNYNPKTRSLGQ